MTQDIAMLKGVFSTILSREGITAPIQQFDVEGLRDEPGFHWSNPGLKSVSMTAGDRQFSIVVKRLGEHAKREVLVYRALSGHEGFPIPRLFHSVYDDEKAEYWIVTERCVGRPFDCQEPFWEQCGLLLARIHAAFWRRTDALPDLFLIERAPARALTVVRKLIDFLDSLSAGDAGALSHVAGSILSELRPALARVKRERLPVAHPPAKCLIHRAFHPPEIMWRRLDEGYTPVAVDWEQARIGAPQEDFATAGSLLARGEEDLVQVFVGSYLDELNTHGIPLSGEECLISVRSEALLGQMETAPWLVSQYLRKRDEATFAGWCKWVVKELPVVLGYIQRGVEEGDLYGGG